MEQIADAPWIRQAEMYGYPDYDGPDKQEWRSHQVKDSVVYDLKQARDLIQKAAQILESVEEGTVWEEEILDLYELAYGLGLDLDNKATEVERW